MMKFLKLLLSGLGFILSFNATTYANSIEAKSANPVQESEMSDEERRYMQELMSMMPKPSAGQSKSIENVFYFYNLGDFSDIYSDLIDSKIKPLKSEDRVLKILSDIKQYAGDYISGRKSGIAMGQQMIASDDKGNLLNSAVSFKTKTIKWQANFEKNTLYFDFIFVEGETDSKLYLVKVADSQLAPEFERDI